MNLGVAKLASTSQCVRLNESLPLLGGIVFRVLRKSPCERASDDPRRNDTGTLDGLQALEFSSRSFSAQAE